MGRYGRAGIWCWGSIEAERMGLKAEGGEHGAWSKNKKYNPFSIRYALCSLLFAI